MKDNPIACHVLKDLIVVAIGVQKILFIISCRPIKSGFVIQEETLYRKNAQKIFLLNDKTALDWD
jgi:hypothetical protein